VPLMPAPEPRPVPLALAQARIAFDALVNRRVQALRDLAGVGAPITTSEPSPEQEAAYDASELLAALARSFADEVDRANDGRQYLRQQPLDYVDAVVLTGTAGALVVDSVEYETAPVYWQAHAGEVDSIIEGRDLDGYLRTGEQQYAEKIGLQ
jgi:hypothetical protein